MLTPNALLLVSLLNQAPVMPAPETLSAEAPAPQSDAATSAAQSAAEAARSSAESNRRLADAADRIAAVLERTSGAMKAPAAAGKRDQRWTGSVGVGLISLTGNASTLTVTANALAEYRTDNWSAQGKASGAYGTSAAAGSDERSVVAEAAAGSLRGERRFSPVLSGYGLIGAETNHLASLELRTTAEIGLGITLLDLRVQEKERAFLRTDVAMRYSQDYRFQYYPFRQNLENVLLLAPGAGFTFRYAVNEAVSLSQTAEILPNVVGDARLVANANTKVLAKLTDRFSFNVAFGVVYDSKPAEGKVSTDTALTVGVEVSL